MDTGKLLKLVGLLRKRTREDRIKWKETVEESTFLTSFPENSVLIARRQDRVHTLVLLDGRGDAVGEVSSYALPEDSRLVNQLGALYSAVQEARGADSAVDTIIRELEKEVLEV